MFLKAKFTSRKFWLTVLNTIINVVLFFFVTEWAQVVPLGLITFGIVGFVVSEAIVDSARIDNSVIHHVVYDDEAEEESEETEND